MSDAVSPLSTPFKIGNITVPNRTVMAPMCNITHKPFRKLTKEYGAGLVVTQMVSAKALTLGCAKTKKLLEFDESERPIAFQVFGNNADTLGEAAKMLQDMGPDMVDLNMGCPAKKIVNDGGGSALLKTPALTQDIFTKMRKALTIPFTVKMRAGYDKYGDESMAMARMAQDSGVDALAVHGRTKAQGYSGHADWDLIKQFKSELKIPVIGNGDVLTHDDAANMLSQTGCDGVMIGRAAVSEPWFFRSCHTRQNIDLTAAETRALIMKQYEDFFAYYGHASGIKMMRKHLCAYTKGLRDGSIFRNELIRMEDWPAIQQRIYEFFSDVDQPHSGVEGEAPAPINDARPA